MKTKQNTNKRLTFIDIAKGIGIILMVIGHTGFMDYYISLFHMPLFFFLAGYTYTYHDGGLSELKETIKRRIQSLYIPFIKYELFFTLFFNVFVYFHLIDSDYNKIPNTVNMLDSILTLNVVDNLTGAAWFIPVIFIVSISFAIACVLAQKLKKIMNPYITLLLISLIMLTIGYYFSLNEIHMAKNIEVVFSVFVIYYLGYIAKHIKIKESMQIPLCILSVGVLFYISKYGSISIAFNKYFSPLILIIASISGSKLVIGISKLIEKTKYLSNVLQYIGKNTLPIMFLHLLCFKLVTYVQILRYKQDIDTLKSYPVFISTNGWWVIYSVVGIVLPLLSICIVKYLYQILIKNRVTG